MTQRNSNYKIPYLSNETLKEAANAFLQVHNPENEIPVPIEKIVEYNLKIKIIPTKELKRIWGWDGYINSALDTIYIDEFVYENYNERTIFTIAHELAHVVLHEDYYKSLSIDNEQSFLNQQDDPSMVSIEAQAYAFAGYLLLPSTTFNPKFESMLSEYTRVDAEDLGLILQTLASEFEVSDQCIYKQVKREFPEVLQAIEIF